MSHFTQEIPLTQFTAAGLVRNGHEPLPELSLLRVIGEEDWRCYCGRVSRDMRGTSLAPIG